MRDDAASATASYARNWDNFSGLDCAGARYTDVTLWQYSDYVWNRAATSTVATARTALRSSEARATGRVAREYALSREKVWDTMVSLVC